MANAASTWAAAAPQRKTAGGPSVYPNLFYKTELWTKSRMNPSVGKKQRCLMNEHSKLSEMKVKVKLLTRPQLVQQQPSTPIFFWPQRLIACSAGLAPLLLLTPCAEPSYSPPPHQIRNTNLASCTGSHSLQLNFGVLDRDNLWLRKQVIDNISF